MRIACRKARAPALLLVLAAAGCRAAPTPAGQQPTTIVVGSSSAMSSPPSAAPSAPAPAATMMTFEATVRIDDAIIGKRFPFRRVLLVRDDGERLIAADYPEPWHEAFADRRVRVRAEPYEAEREASPGQHVRIESLRLASDKPDPSASLVEVKAERSYRGHFEQYVWEQGTKLAGEAATVFVSDEGGRFWLANAVDPKPEPEVAVTVRGREVEPSPYVSRPGGAYLWILDVSR